MTRVKICGLRDVERAATVVEAGADLLGFIFYPPVRRYVDPSAARAIVRALPRGQVEYVGVFVNATPDHIDEVARLVGLDRVQLAGDESVEMTRRLGWPVIRTVHVDATTERDAVIVRGRGAALIHLDARRAGSYGGTGTTIDWHLADQIGRIAPVLLAGGLTPENVAEAIATADPWGVDVSSGVETDGEKDPRKIAAFVTAARATARKGVASR